MKLFARTLLLLTVIFTLAIYFWWKPPRAAVAELPADQVDANVATSSAVVVKPTETSAVPQPPPAAATNLDWTGVESSDYKQYIANLRALGVPEEGIRALIIPDINQLYEPREAPLRAQLATDDQSPDRRRAAAANADL